MDRRDPMALSGSTSYYMPSGMAGSGTQAGLQGSPGIRSLSNPNVQFQSNIGGNTIGSTLQVEPSSSISHGVNVGAPSAVPQNEPVKRKRGRPRKYGPDGTVSLALSPSPPIHTGKSTITSSQKRGRGRPPGTGRKQQLASLGKFLGPIGFMWSVYVYHRSPKRYIAFCTFPSYLLSIFSYCT